MPDFADPLTALQLYEIRANLRQSPVAMAGLLGVNLSSYYHYERTGKIPRPVAVAVRFLSQQTHLAGKPTTKTRETTKFKARFLPGARFGTLLVLCHAPTSPGSKRPRVQVKCDCGKEMTMQIRELDQMTHCGPRCPKRQVVPPPPVALFSDDGADENSDMLDLDATPEERHAYNVRKFREQIDAEKAAAAAQDEEWEAGL